MTANGGPNSLRNPSVQCDDIPWVCNHCPTLLAYIDRSTRNAVRIKARTTVVWVVFGEGLMGIVCRKCSAYNERVWSKEPETAQAPK